ncbi:hypothetical protein JN853_15765 [Pseudomonas syringae pv. actinidiae ICMP 9853]|nr:hypothetical protein JN853_15765 [Pseudomonas syringae pv. actinidiae ICMP 9853]
MKSWEIIAKVYLEFLHTLGPVQLARRPASHPPDQRQGSAVTYVALCVVSDIAVKKRLTIVRRSASHAVLDALRPLCGASRHMLVLRVSEIRARLKSPFRPSATDLCAQHGRHPRGESPLLSWPQ